MVGQIFNNNNSQHLIIRPDRIQLAINGQRWTITMELIHQLTHLIYRNKITTIIGKKNKRIYDSLILVTSEKIIEILFTKGSVWSSLSNASSGIDFALSELMC